MADKNIFEELFLEAEKTNLQVLMDNALNEKDPDKKKVLMEIYTYAIGKKQKELLKRQIVKLNRTPCIKKLQRL